MIRVPLQHPDAKPAQSTRCRAIGPSSSSSAPIGMRRNAARRPLTFPLLEAPSQLPLLSNHEESPVPHLKVFGVICGVAAGLAVTSPG
jgi:hypothetical protein